MNIQTISIIGVFSLALVLTITVGVVRVNRNKEETQRRIAADKEETQRQNSHDRALVEAAQIPVSITNLLGRYTSPNGHFDELEKLVDGQRVLQNSE
jgi:hypothetical protein